MRKTLILAAVLFATVSTFAANIQLAWDNSLDTNAITNCVYYGEAQGGTNLSTYGTTNQWTYDQVKTNIVSTNAVVYLPLTSTTVSLNLTNSGQLYWFFVTCKDVWGNESDTSNVLFWKNGKPAKPGNMKQKVVIFFNGE